MKKVSIFEISLLLGVFFHASRSEQICADMPSFMNNNAKIVGGQDVPSPIPWQVSLIYNSDQHFCGGTILNNFTILSAAHCFFGYPETGYSIRAGSTKWSTGGQTRNIVELIWNTNPGFEFIKEKTENDYVLLKLDSALEFNNDVQPACLPTSSDYLDTKAAGEINEQCFTSGWGLLYANFNPEDYEIGESPETCQYVRMPVIKNKKCAKAYSHVTTEPIPDSIFCAGYVDEPGKGGCNGDSGGPLVCNVDGKAVISGVVSSGDLECGALPTVYARVSHVLSWIQDNLDSTAPPKCEDVAPGKFCKKNAKKCKKAKIYNKCKKTCNKCNDEPEECKDKKSAKFCKKNAKKCKKAKIYKKCKKTCNKC